MWIEHQLDQLQKTNPDAEKEREKAQSGANDGPSAGKYQGNGLQHYTMAYHGARRRSAREVEADRTPLQIPFSVDTSNAAAPIPRPDCSSLFARRVVRSGTLTTVAHRHPIRLHIDN